MKRFMTTLLGAGLAVLLAGAAQAEMFTIDRTVLPPAGFTHTSGAGDVIIDFTTAPGETLPPIDSTDPGNAITALNFQLRTTGTPSLYTFNDAFTLAITFKSYGPASAGATHTVNFNGTVTGQLSATTNSVAVNLTPQTVNFMLGSVPFVLDEYQPTKALVNNPNSFGAISYRAISPIPEPGSMALLAMGGLPFLGMIRRRRK